MFQCLKSSDKIISNKQQSICSRDPCCGTWRRRPSGAADYLLVDVRYGVHPAADAHLVPDIGRVTEFMDNADVIGVGTTKQLLLQGQCVHLGKTSQTGLWTTEENTLEIYLLRAWMIFLWDFSFKIFGGSENQTVTFSPEHRLPCWEWGLVKFFSASLLIYMSLFYKHPLKSGILMEVTDPRDPLLSMSIGLSAGCITELQMCRILYTLFKLAYCQS